MKKRCKAQISVEYILIITLALMILLPGVYLFRNYALESNDRIIQSRLAEISNQVFVKAREMYYYGPPSKSVVTVELPSQINSFYILSIPSNNEYYLVFDVLTTDGENEFTYESEVPLEANLPDCTPSENCNQGFCKCFPERFYSEGIKNFEVQASENCVSAVTCIMIDEISPDIT